MRNRPFCGSSCIRRPAHLLAVCLCILALAGCGGQSRFSVAVIPRTTATIHWESLHTGVEDAAYRFGIRIYRNAPTREDDIHGQIALMDRLVATGGYQALVVAPDQSLALISPVRRALAKGIPIVILGSPLLMPPGGKLFYVPALPWPTSVSWWSSKPSAP